jgi:hypothetical protein
MILKVGHTNNGSKGFSTFSDNNPFPMIMRDRKVFRQMRFDYCDRPFIHVFNLFAYYDPIPVK